MIAVDMDGTFLDENSSYDHQEFFKIYQKLKKNGIRFVVASGNPLKQLQNQFYNYLKILINNLVLQLL